ncbi:hypothetical protein S40293_11608, partial [Stachybotrys chartarum IBT 40293]
NII